MAAVPALRAPDDEAATGESLFDDSEDTSSAVDPTEAPRALAVPDGPSLTALEASPRPRATPRAGPFVDADVPEDESAAPEPAEPPEPVVSATATGTDATAEPTPNATANAPTRPTYRA